MVVPDVPYEIETNVILGAPLYPAGEGAPAWGHHGLPDGGNVLQLGNIPSIVDIRDDLAVAQKKSLLHTQENEEYIIRNLTRLESHFYFLEGKGDTKKL